MRWLSPFIVFSPIFLASAVGFIELAVASKWRRATVGPSPSIAVFEPRVQTVPVFFSRGLANGSHEEVARRDPDGGWTFTNDAGPMDALNICTDAHVGVVAVPDAGASK